MDQGRRLIKNISQQISKSSYCESATRECIMLELYLSTPKCQLDWYFKFLFLTRFYFDIHYTTPYPKRAKKTTRFWLIYRLIKLGEQGWRSGESTRVPPMWPGFKSRRRRHMWVEFVVGSLPCSERFFSGYSGFPLSSKTNTSKFQFDLERTDTFKRVQKNS